MLTVMHGTMTNVVVRAPAVLGSGTPRPTPVLVGACDPRSYDPAHALWPDPPGCTGWRIWRLLETVRPGVTPDEYLRAFRRVNLCRTPAWDGAEAQARAIALVMGLEPGAEVVMLGEDVRRAADAALGGLPRLLVHPQQVRGARGVVVRQLPHPSGRCHWYNSPANRLVAALLLGELYDRA